MKSRPGIALGIPSLLVALLLSTGQAAASTTPIGRLAPNPTTYEPIGGYSYAYSHPPASLCETSGDYLQQTAR